MIWKAVAVFFYIELVICFFLLFSIFSPRRWQRLLHSNLMTTVWSYSKFYLTMFALLLFGLFIGAINDIQKQEKKRSSQLPPAEAQIVLKQLFRAQRNYFITMFATILVFVIYRIGSLIFAQATLEDEEEKTLRQLRETAELVTRTSTETDARVKEQNRLELYEAHNEMRRLKEQLLDVEKHKQMMQTDLENSRREIEDLSVRYSELEVKFQKMKFHEGVPMKKDV